jgi:hypothetical protein
MHIPESNKLPVNLLAACFNNTSATYKFYWFLSILQNIEKGDAKINKRELFANMISNSWYTVNYFNVSFGKQDLIQDAIKNIKDLESISIDEKKDRINAKLISSNNPATNKMLNHFDKNVPHWFLSPWFPRIENESDSKRYNRIYSESQLFKSDCIYALYKDFIEINPTWYEYLFSNVKVLKDFCFWNLALFLQSKNPNVPGIPNKLFKQAERNSLNNQRTKFWDIVLHELGSIECIYKGTILSKGNYAVEHFIPYSFVSHDLIWNLIPADKSFNSSKSNKLPSMEEYFDSFYLLQKSAYEIISYKDPKNKFLEDYHSVLNFENNTINKENFKNTLQSLIIIAANNGFEYLKSK